MQKSLPQAKNFFENIILPVLTQEQTQDCEKEISKKEVIDTLKRTFMNSISQTKISKKYITSQRQAIMKLIE